MRLGESALLLIVDAQTGQVAVASRGTPIPTQPPIGWSGWTLLPTGPKLAKDREIAAVTPDNLTAEMFAVDREGLL